MADDIIEPSERRNAAMVRTELARLKTRCAGEAAGSNAYPHWGRAEAYLALALIELWPVARPRPEPSANAG